MTQPHRAGVRLLVRMASSLVRAIRRILCGCDQSLRDLDFAEAAMARQVFHLVAILIARLDGHLGINARRVAT